MQKLSRLQHPTLHPAAPFATEETNNDDPHVAKHGPAGNPTTTGATGTAAAAAAATRMSSASATRTTMRPIGGGGGYGKHAPLIAARSRRLSLSLDGGHDDDEGTGCLDAVSAFLLAIANTSPAANKPESQQVGGVLPQLLRATKGAGTIESRDSSRDLLRFFGHSPVLHLEAVVWIKASGERGDGLQWPNRRCPKYITSTKYQREHIFSNG